MSKYKVCVYAICKNESKNARRWYNSMKEADEVIVLDTGSTDDTVEILKSLGAKVYIKEYPNFRFDDARNDSLDLVPLDCDICVCTDIDECFNSGWREKVEKVWDSNVHRLSYKIIWNVLDNGKEGLVYYISKIHKRENFKWIHAIHEILEYTGSEYCNTVTLDSVYLTHYQDKNKSRANYLKLLELDAMERPNDARSMHYLGREYMYYNMLDKAILVLKKHLTMENSNWPAERAASMRYIAMCYERQGKIDEARKYLFYSIGEAPKFREAYIQLAKLEYIQKNFNGVVYLINIALKITQKSTEYLNEAEAWGILSYDLLSIAFYYLGNYEQALINIDICLKEEPLNSRFLNNKKLILEKIKPK